MSFIGLDIGTTTICGVLFDPENASIRKVRRIENDSFIPTNHPWEHIQDPLRILELASVIISDFEREADRIDGISLSSQMHGIVYVNTDGEPVSPFYTWLDNRASQQGRRGKTYLEEYQDLTGKKILSGFGLATHFSLMKNDRLPSEPCKFCSIGDFIALKLTGRTFPVTDTTLAHSFGGYDLHTKTFRRDELTSAGIDADILPEIVVSHQIVGRYKQIPVVTAIGDNQAGFLGSVSDSQSMALMNLGTSGQISCYSKELLETDALEVRPFVDGGFLIVGASLCGGKAYALLANFFQETLKWFGFQHEGSIFETMNDINYAACGDPFEVEPFFRGSRANIHRRAVFRNITDSNFLPQNLTAGIAIGIVRELYEYFASLPEDYTRQFLKIIGAGNLLSKNRNILQVVENVFQREVVLCQHDESSSIGAAINAAVGTGVYSSYQERVI